MDVIKMYATAERGNYFVSVVIDGEFVTGAQAIGPAPDKTGTSANTSAASR